MKNAKCKMRNEEWGVKEGARSCVVFNKSALENKRQRDSRTGDYDYDYDYDYEHEAEHEAEVEMAGLALYRELSI